MKKVKLTKIEKVTQAEIDEAYKSLMFWLVQITVRAAKALRDGKTDV